MSRKAVKTSTSTDVKSELPRNLLKDAVAAGNLTEIKRVLTEHKELIVDCVSEIIKLTSEQIRDIVQWMVAQFKLHTNIHHVIFEIAITSQDLQTIRFIKAQGIEQYDIVDTKKILITSINRGDYSFLRDLHEIGYEINMWDSFDKSVIYAAKNGELDFIEIANTVSDFGTDFLNIMLKNAAANGNLDVVKYCYNRGADLFADNCAAIKAADDWSEIVEFLKSEMNQPYVIANMQRQQTQKNHEVIVDMLERLTGYIEEISGCVGETSNTVSDIKTELTSFRESYDDVHQ
jgi:hypothetical protein